VMTFENLLIVEMSSPCQRHVDTKISSTPHEANTSSRVTQITYLPSRSPMVALWHIPYLTRLCYGPSQQMIIVNSSKAETRSDISLCRGDGTPRSRPVENNSVNKITPRKIYQFERPWLPDKNYSVAWDATNPKNPSRCNGAHTNGWGFGFSDTALWS
jgi:hypothetical protein